MGRQASIQKQADREARQLAELRADLARLRVVTKDCYSPYCGCHWREWREISVIRGLLGKDPTV